jgi:secondary thiamine-phosphate synthase enzyme
VTAVSSAINFDTRGNGDFRDITAQLQTAVDESGLSDGVLTVFCPSSTSAVTTIEYETGALQDLSQLFDEIIPSDRAYAHNARWGDGNGHSHVRAALLGPSLSIPFANGELTLGTWQQVIHVDFDNRPRRRRLVVQMIG